MALRVKQGFQRVVLSRHWLAFIVMGLAFLVFGAGSLNLIYMLSANVNLLVDYGWQAVMDGGGWQLFGLLASGYASMAAYLVFKACEHSLVLWVSEVHTPPPTEPIHQEPEAKDDHEDRPLAR